MMLFEKFDITMRSKEIPTALRVCCQKNSWVVLTFSSKKPITIEFAFPEDIGASIVDEITHQNAQACIGSNEEWTFFGKVYIKFYVHPITYRMNFKMLKTKK